MSGKRIKTYQIQVYMKARKEGLPQEPASTIAGISLRSGQRIDAGEQATDRGHVATTRRVADPLASVWASELEPMLRSQPSLKPTTLYEYLQEQHPGKYGSVLRTLQRRVQAWKAIHGDSPEVMFELRHEPGLLGLSDFTELKGISITIKGQRFEHILYHYRLGYSGWQYAQIIQGGESFIALSEGLQNALQACGGSPKQHRTDSLSAAYRNHGGGPHKPLTHLYDELCHHYRLQPTRNNLGIAHENGAIECSHGHLKNRISQALLLRDSHDFTSVAEYQALIDSCVAKLNGQHADKYAQEQLALQPLPKHRIPDYEILTVRVSCHSTIDVRCILYTVPSRLIGRTLELHLYHDRILGYIGPQQVVTLPRLRSNQSDKRRARCINYRHVIEGLRRKPRAFIYCTWQDDLLPNQIWRDLWQQMRQQFDLDSAAKVMVEALFIAATQDKETAVANYLETEIAQQQLTLVRLQQHFQLLPPKPLPQQQIQQHDLQSYDQLLTRPETATEPEPQQQTLSQPQPLPQTTQTS
jgi:hypothetical protein